MTATAAALAATANAWFTTRAADEWAGDWADRDAYTRFVAHVQSGRAWAKDSRTVVACVAPGRVWQYIAADALDNAAGNTELPDTARIDVKGRFATLTW
jgi:hypothetical protein